MLDPFHIKVSGLSDPAWLAEAQRLYGLMGDEGVLPERLSGPFAAQTGLFILDPTKERQSLGMAIVYRPDGQDCLWLDLLYVEKNFRRAGLAKKLVDCAARRARVLGLPRLEFGTLLGNAAMISLAGKARFDERGVFFSREVGR